jgi:hypothetical protein
MVRKLPKLPQEGAAYMPSIRGEQLVAALSRLGDAGEAERQAKLINPLMFDVVMQGITRGHDIGRDLEGFYARRKTSPKGPARELRDLAAAGRKAVGGKLDVEDWIMAWAAAPARITRLWKPPFIQTKKGRTLDHRKLLGFSSPKFSMVAPRAADVLPAIERELARITAMPGEKRRKSNEVEIAAIEAIRSAYRALTGKTGGRVIHAGKLDGRMVRLGREIDGIFGTKLFAAKDSVRLRR